MKLEELKVRDKVVINDNSEWGGKHGVVQAVYPELDFADVFCVQEPTRLYRVFKWNSNCIVRDI